MDEQEVSSSSLMNTTDKKDRLRIKKKTLQMVLEQCQRALESLDDSDDLAGVDSDDDDAGECCDGEGESSGSNREADELCDLLKSRVECPDFLDKLGSASPSIPEHISDEGGSWDMVSKNDLWEDGDENAQDDFVLVSQEDIVDGIAGFMAAYLLSLKQTKDLSPNKLQEALSKTFSVKKKKGKLRKAWDGSKVIYNVASWGATAIGIYQNPALLKVASDAFWASCQVISKLL